MVSFAFRVALPPWAKSFIGAVRRAVPLNFITLHYTYYIVACMVSAIIFWGSSTPAQSITFTDSLFLTVSAMTQAGLNTVNLSQLNTWQQILLFILMLIGSPILISAMVVHTRKVAFEKRFAKVIEDERRRRKTLKSTITVPFTRTRSRKTTMQNGPASPVVDGVVVRGRPIIPAQDPPEENEKTSAENRNNSREQRITESSDAPAPTGADGPDQTTAEANGPAPTEPQSPSDQMPENTTNHITFVDTRPPRIMSPRRMQQSPGAMSRRTRSFYLHTPRTPPAEGFPLSSKLREEFKSTAKYFESDGLIGRNSQFHSLSLEERERLGGVEYRAVVLLEGIVITYYILWQLIGCLGLGAWIAYNANATTLQNGLNPWWVGIFLGVSGFSNNGMSLLDANMVAFQSSYYVLITLSLLILAGNTCYPIFLRLILWSLMKLLPDGLYFKEHKQTLRFLLDHPRRCYTTLFQSNHTWWLLGSLIALNGIDWVGFEILNIGNTSVLPTGSSSWAIDGLFQAFAVRSGGFYVVPIASLRAGLLVLYAVMMYISVYPVSITLRNSNVYEERSLGIYADDADGEDPKSASKLPAFISRLRHSTREGSRSYFIRQQLRGQLAHDLWWLCVAVLFITIIETPQVGKDPITFATFNIIFETVSAYGTVGISTGAPNVAFSFSGLWHVLSKLILCAVMIRGRHRGLPVSIDRAVLLPGEHLGHAEEEDAVLRRELTTERKAMRSQTSHHVNV